MGDPIASRLNISMELMNTSRTYLVATGTSYLRSTILHVSTKDPATMR